MTSCVSGFSNTIFQVFFTKLEILVNISPHFSVKHSSLGNTNIICSIFFYEEQVVYRLLVVQPGVLRRRRRWRGGVVFWDWGWSRSLLLTLVFWRRRRLIGRRLRFAVGARRRTWSIWDFEFLCKILSARGSDSLITKYREVKKKLKDYWKLTTNMWMISRVVKNCVSEVMDKKI